METITKEKGRKVLVAFALSALIAPFSAAGTEDPVVAEFVEVDELTVESESRRGVDFSPLENMISEMEYTGSVGWYSKYVCEGLDRWGAGYFNLTLGADYQDRWHFGFWYGIADGYDSHGDRCGEIKLQMSYKIPMGSLDIIPWFEQSFIRQNNDRGVPRPGIKTAYHFNEFITAGTDFYWQDYDLETGERGEFRGYYTAYISGVYDVTDFLSLEGSLRYGYNGGYVQSARHGSNALDYLLTANWKLCDYCAISGTLGFSQALTVLRQEDRGDEFFAGLALNFSY